MKRKRILTPNEVAEMLMVSPITVRQWAQKGMIEARTTAGGHRRFELEMVEEFARRMGIDIMPSNPRVLVVDDNQKFNEYLVVVLEALGGGIEVESAFDGFDAGRKVHQFKPNRILLDIMMPGLDGIQVCKAIKEDPATREIKVVAMTGHYTPELESKMLAAGAEFLLKKPFDKEEMLLACELGGSDAAEFNIT
ncbi:MAG: response regulator [Pseudomonadales bacterium]|nr:response regulator [Pseudomonadales bacterium]